MLSDAYIPQYEEAPVEWDRFMDKASRGSEKAVSFLANAGMAYMVDLTGDEDSPSTLDLDDYARMFRHAFPSRPPFETGQEIVEYGSAHGWFKAFRLTTTAKNPRNHYQELWARNATADSSALINNAVLDCFHTWGADSALASLDIYGLGYDSLAAVTGMMFLALTWPQRKEYLEPL